MQAREQRAWPGAWVPALVFGIPGDSVTAIVMGVLLMKNIKPGPEIFEKQAVLVYSIFLIFFLANLFLIAAGFLAIKAGGYVVRIPRKILLPLILLFCVIGSYAINGSYFDIGVMLAMGGLGFALERRQIPLGPVVLGIILGGPLEERFIQTLSSSGARGRRSSRARWPPPWALSRCWSGSHRSSYRYGRCAVCWSPHPGVSRGSGADRPEMPRPAADADSPRSPAGRPTWRAGRPDGCLPKTYLW